MAKTPKTTINEDLVRQLAGLLDETGLSEIEYGNDGLTIRVAKHAQVTAVAATSGAAAPPLSAPPPAAAALEEPSFNDHPGAVTSPMVGVVYLSPEPNSPPFVQAGDEVTEGQTLFLIEAMKVFNPIAAPRSGKVAHILVDSETPVEFGEPLAVIE